MIDEAAQRALDRHILLYGSPTLKPGDVIEINAVTGEVRYHLASEKKSGPEGPPSIERADPT